MGFTKLIFTKLITIHVLWTPMLLCFQTGKNVENMVKRKIRP